MYMNLRLSNAKTKRETCNLCKINRSHLSTDVHLVVGELDFFERHKRLVQLVTRER